MEIAKKRIAELQNLAKEKGGDIASKAAEKAKDLPGADKVGALLLSSDSSMSDRASFVRKGPRRRSWSRRSELLS